VTPAALLAQRRKRSRHFTHPPLTSLSFRG
jgi:hypothetical protein